VHLPPLHGRVTLNACRIVCGAHTDVGHRKQQTEEPSGERALDAALIEHNCTICMPANGWLNHRTRRCDIASV
jgi:hypothetical protein